MGHGRPNSKDLDLLHLCANDSTRGDIPHSEKDQVLFLHRSHEDRPAGSGSQVICRQTASKSACYARIYQVWRRQVDFTGTLAEADHVVGLNLTSANNVIMLDHPWTRAAESQAIDRVHRIVSVHRRMLRLMSGTRKTCSGHASGGARFGGGKDPRYVS